ncbi:MAG: PIN domain-containing protein [Verrucomicrobiales bacterium]|nr:PIN domain-containing protein [Verrucomicrobiales bacterium]
MIFDTDVFIWAQRGNLKAAALIDGCMDRAISLQTYMEFIEASKDKRQLRLNQDFLRSFAFQTLAFTENIGHRAAIYIEQFALSHGMRSADAIIAATASEHQRPLVTANAKHYRHLSDVEIVVLKP